MAGLHKTKYTENEIMLIKKYYPDLDMLVKLIPTHNRKSIISKAGLMGISKKQNPKFTEEEIETLKKYYPSNGGKYVQEHYLPNRKLYEIHQKAFLLKIAHLTYNQDYFEKVDSNEKAYWLGFIYADGYVTKNTPRFGIELAKTDISHLQKFLDCINSNMKIRTRIVENKFEHKNKDFLENCSIIINNRKLHSDLMNLGVNSTKTQDVIFPTELFDEQYMWHFIRGFMDGDGTIGLFTCHTGYKKPHISFVCKSETFMNGFLNWIKNNGFDFNQPSIRGNSLFRFISEKQSFCFSFLELLYKDSTEETRLKRKYKKYLKICDYYNLNGRV